MKKLLCITLLGILARAACAVPVGMAVHLEGKPQAQSGGAWKPLRVLQKLSVGDSVRCGAGDGAVVVLFAGAKRFQIGANATANIGAESVSNAKLLGAARGASARVAASLGGARTGAILFRPAPSYKRLHFQGKTDDVKAPPSRDWLREGERTWEMNAIANATSYVFSLIDPKDYVVWSGTITGNAERVSVALPESVKLKSQRPYVWRLQGFTDAGKLTASYWGITEMLSAEDETKLLADEKDLLNDDGTLPDDVTQLALLVETYRNYGVVENALELLARDALNMQPGVDETRDEILALAGPYAQMLDKQKNDGWK